MAKNDTEAFLSRNLGADFPGLIIDEIQHAPKLLSYLQTIVDQNNAKGRFIITGSQNILINEAISQTLAGRISILTLLPFSIFELKTNNLLSQNSDECIFFGGYPRIFSDDLYKDEVDVSAWFFDYEETYVNRDVRQLLNIGNLALFRKFLRLCAGRIGQLLNIQSLAVDCGIDQRTVASWLSVLEACYIIFLLQPHYKNFNKRLIKSPKLYFYDTGLACAFLEENIHKGFLVYAGKENQQTSIGKIVSWTSVEKIFDF